MPYKAVQLVLHAVRLRAQRSPRTETQPPHEPRGGDQERGDVGGRAGQPGAHAEQSGICCHAWWSAAATATAVIESARTRGNPRPNCVVFVVHSRRGCQKTTAVTALHFPNRRGDQARARVEELPEGGHSQNVAELLRPSERDRRRREVDLLDDAGQIYTSKRAKVSIRYIMFS